MKNSFKRLKQIDSFGQLKDGQNLNIVSYLLKIIWNETVRLLILKKH